MRRNVDAPAPRACVWVCPCADWAASGVAPRTWRTVADAHDDDEEEADDADADDEEEAAEWEEDPWSRCTP